MVDAINGAGGATADPRIAAVARATPAAAAAPASASATDSPAAASQLAALAKAVAATPPVDTDRVQEIKQALQNGTFPILPATIADQMMAFRYEWMSHDEA